MAVTIVNVPNGFAPNMVLAQALRPNGYKAAEFGKQAKALGDAMYKVAPNVPIHGPGTCAADWASAWVDLDLKQPNFLTFHNYPPAGCSTGLDADQPMPPACVNAPSATIPHLCKREMLPTCPFGLMKRESPLA
ncbi:hypothetical protein [Arthrobacter alpinus]|uniref:hypothetical protein n=1 Tax=Arthrobacter alpinus TaxID=656366 RepID=UPI00164663AB|nr:hypothetical protein [Arthrobacter alpinus]